MKIEGIPEGYELVRIGIPQDGDLFMHGRVGHIDQYDESVFYNTVYPIVRKAERPKQYRPFANAEEFKPHRERWWKWKEGTSGVFPPASYDEFGHEGDAWIESFNFKIFEDGSPFGVEVSE